MQEILKFIGENGVIIYPILTFIVGTFIPNIKIKMMGEVVSDKLPESVAKVLAEKIDAFADGLYDLDVEGNKELISNEQLAEKVEGLKIDLTEGK